MNTHNAVTVSDAEFDTQVLKADRPVLLDFWAEWCPPCKMIAPVLEDIATEHGDKLIVGKLDVDNNPNTAMRFGVQSIPTLILFKDGVETERVVGFLPKERLWAKLSPHLA
jgi:thioredoxin 1